MKSILSHIQDIGSYTVPIWILAVLHTVGAVAIKMLTQLATESFLKKAGIIALEKIAAKTETDADDKILQSAKEAWNMND